MKKYLVFLNVILLFPVIIFSKVGTNNFTINIGAFFNSTTISGHNNQTSQPHSFSFLGGGGGIEIGHLYLSHQENQKTIHAADTRIGVEITAGFNPALNTELISLNTYIGTTYAVGFKTKKGRLLFDILGISLGWFSANQQTFINDTLNHSFAGKHFLLSFPLPLGIYYIYDTGLMIGLNHRFDLPISTKPSGYTIKTQNKNSTITMPNDGGSFGVQGGQQLLLSYKIIFSIGYAFGN